jgi:hypothetical protein
MYYIMNIKEHQLYELESLIIEGNLTMCSAP